MKLSDEGLEGEGAMEDKRKLGKVCNVGNLEIVKGIFGDRKWVDNQEQNNIEDQNELSVEDVPKNLKDMGINFLEYACNSMIGNFKSTKWLFYNLEENKKNQNPEKEIIPLSPFYIHSQGQVKLSDEGLEGEGAMDDRRKVSKVYNVGNLEIVKEIFGDIKWEDNQE